ncbi:recombination-associated protein RdgC [Solimonas fluminis]|uniref:Recombination-associated protein RdgC n=1 Tax=Solimonas fluminis TaxID=2086571 RepID=A0A2S5TKF2_9GAMM|nr:recombination-associated protein RdgC [Solimonas fluminis]PPE75443.1 recombination-associated protein RdgC [Solimonas fluminis]
MFFKALVWFDLDEDWDLTPGELEEILAEFPLRPCEGTVARTIGWVAPWTDGALVRNQGRQYLAALGWEQKVLPGAVIKKHLEEKCAEIERQKGYKPGRKMVKDLKEQIILELLPKAFAKPGQLRVWLDLQRHRIVVASSSTRAAEELVEYLRNSLGGELAVSTPEVPLAPANTFTGWVAAREVPGRWALGDSCRIEGRDEDGARISYGRYDLASDDIRHHLTQGCVVTKLALVWNQRVSFTLTERLQLSRIEFLEVRPDTDETQEEAHDADFALMAGDLGELLDDLITALGVERE